MERWRSMIWTFQWNGAEAVGIHAGAAGILGKSAHTREVHLEPRRPIGLERREESVQGQKGNNYY